MQDEQIIRVASVPAQVRVGVSDIERAHPQMVRFSVTLRLATPPAFADHDRLADTVDYDHVIRVIQHVLPAEGPTRLIETLADRAAHHCLALSRRILSATVEVEKPSVLQEAGLVSVAITRTLEPAALHAKAAPEAAP